MHDDAPVVVAHRPHLAAAWPRTAATTRTRAPSGTARPIELPIVSIHNVPASARRRSRRVIVSGGVVPSDMSDRPAVWSKPHASSRPPGRSGRRVVGRRRSAVGRDRRPVRGLRRFLTVSRIRHRLRLCEFDSTTARASRSPSRSVIHRDRCVARRRRRGVSERFRRRRETSTATTSTSVGRRRRRRTSIRTRRPGHSIWRRRFAAASNTSWPTRSPSTAGTRCTRHRSGHGDHVVVALGRHGGRQVDAGVRGVASTNGRCSATT